MGCKVCNKKETEEEQINFSNNLEQKEQFMKFFNEFLKKSGNEKLENEEFDSNLPEKYLKLSNEQVFNFPEKFVEKNHLFDIQPIKFKNGNIYKGKWNQRYAMEGKGKYYIKDDDIFIEGFWENGELIYGKIFMPDGCIYEGHTKDSKFNGQGKLILEDAVYEGEFENGEFKNGKLKWNNGYEYDGNFKGNYLQGKGILKSPNGDIYEGDFVNSQFHGKGKYTYFNSQNTYEGEFQYGIKKGKGKYTAKNEYIYDGNWDNDMPFGYGKLSKLDNSCVLKCTFRAGKIAEDPIYEIGSKENFNPDEFEIKPEETIINTNALTNLNKIENGPKEFILPSLRSFLSD